jgi:hypothetical protein
MRMRIPLLLRPSCAVTSTMGRLDERQELFKCTSRLEQNSWALDSLSPHPWPGGLKRIVAAPGNRPPRDPNNSSNSNTNINVKTNINHKREDLAYTPSSYALTKNPHIQVSHGAFSPNTLRLTEDLDNLLDEEDDESRHQFFRDSASGESWTKQYIFESEGGTAEVTEWVRRTGELADAEVEIPLSPLVSIHLVRITYTKWPWTSITSNTFEVMKRFEATMMRYRNPSTLEGHLHHLRIGGISNVLCLLQLPMIRPSSGWSRPPRRTTHPRSRLTTTKLLTPVPLHHIDPTCMILAWATRQPPCSTISPFHRP